MRFSVQIYGLTFKIINVNAPAYQKVSIDLLGLLVHSKAFSFLTNLRGFAVLTALLAEGLMMLQPDKMVPMYLSSAFFALSTILSIVTTIAYVKKFEAWASKDFI